MKSNKILLAIAIICAVSYWVLLFTGVKYLCDHAEESKRTEKECRYSKAAVDFENAPVVMRNGCEYYVIEGDHFTFTYVHKGDCKNIIHRCVVNEK